MPTYRQPGVYVEEDAVAGLPFTGPTQTITAFAGPALAGPVGESSATLERLADFADVYGPVPDQAGPELLFWRAVEGFFLEGGTALIVVRTADTSLAGYQAAFAALETIDGLSVVAAPGAAASGSDETIAITQALIDHATRTDRFAIVESPAGLDIAAIQQWRARFTGDHAALYFPWIAIAYAGDAAMTIPPAGHVAGLFARTDTGKGVWKAPTGNLVSVTGLESIVTDSQQALLNPAGINCIRTFAGRGIQVFGARTITADPQFSYISVRRLISMIQGVVAEGLKPVVFEPDTGALWAEVRHGIENYLAGLWRAGALAGAKPEQAFFARCDRATMTQDDVDHGRLICEIGIAPLKPAEFIVVRITQTTANSP